MKQILLLLLSSFCIATEGADETDISRLRQEILRNYDKNARPVQTQNNVTVVEVYFFNYGFEFNEKNGVLTLHALVVLIWKDEHIRWDPLMYGNLTAVQFHPTELWLPDITVFDIGFGKSELDHFGNTLIHATSESMLLWVPPAKLAVLCDNVDYYRWPFDTQRCEISLASWAHDGNEIELRLQENHTKMDDDLYWAKKPLQNREWNLVDNSVQLGSWAYDCCPDSSITEITIRMDIQRRSSTHVAGVVIVAIGISTSILCSFWLNPFAKERIPVILVAFLLNCTYLNHIYNIIPNNGNHAPWIVCYFRDSLVMVVLALLWTIFLRYIAKTKRNSTVPLPMWVDHILDGVVGTILCLSSRPNEQVRGVNGPEDDYNELMQQEESYRSDWGWFANVLDRIVFLIYFIVYTCFMFTF